MLRKLSVNLFLKKVVVSFFALVGVLIFLPSHMSPQAQRPPGPSPVEQCITLFKKGSERVSAQVKKDNNGCIQEKEKVGEEEIVAIKFFFSTDCTGDEVTPTWEDPDSGFVYKSGVDGGCPEAVEVYRRNPTCVTLTLVSGRKATICW